MKLTLKTWLYAVLAGTTTFFIVNLIKLTAAEDLATAATVWAAFGTLAAVVVALILAQSAHLERSASEAKRHAAAAILVTRQLYKLHAILDVVAKNAALVRTNKDGYAHWLSTISANLGRLEPIVQDKYLPLITELPALDLFTLSVCDEWFNNFRERSLFSEGATVAEVVDHFDPFVDELVRGMTLINSASKRFFQLSGVSDEPPWASYRVPSWAQPTQAK